MTEGKCPDMECHDRVTQIGTCLKSKISFKQMLVGLSSVLLIISAFLVPFVILRSQSLSGQREKINTLRNDQAVCKEQVKEIKNNIKSIKINISKLQENQITQDDLKNLVKEIKEAVKK